jgi:hypothetical protein
VTKFAFRPAVEELNARITPSSGLTAKPPVLAAAQVSAIPSHPYQGAGQGTFVKQTAAPGVGATHQISGRVKLPGFGEFLSLGSIQAPGIQNIRATGQITLHDYKGTITLKLHSLPRPMYSGVPFEMVYSIVGGTGAYAGVKGYGLATFTFNTNGAYSLKVS